MISLLDQEFSLHSIYVLLVFSVETAVGEQLIQGRCAGDGGGSAAWV